MVLEEMNGFSGVGVADAQVDVGEYDGLVVCFHYSGFYQSFSMSMNKSFRDG